MDGAGAAVLSRLVVAAALEAGSLIALNMTLPRRQFFTLRHKERAITRAEREFCTLLDSAAPKRSTRQPAGIRKV
jgi:DNA-binding transcriptional LysR family regulator